MFILVYTEITHHVDGARQDSGFHNQVSDMILSLLLIVDNQMAIVAINLLYQ